MTAGGFDSRWIVVVPGTSPAFAWCNDGHAGKFSSKVSDYYDTFRRFARNILKIMDMYEVSAVGAVSRAYVERLPA
jgi:hypothetical protein